MQWSPPLEKLSELQRQKSMLQLPPSEENLGVVILNNIDIHGDVPEDTNGNTISCSCCNEWILFILGVIFQILLIMLID